jgi:hypothetical protein
LLVFNSKMITLLIRFPDVDGMRYTYLGELDDWKHCFFSFPSKMLLLYNLKMMYCRPYPIDYTKHAAQI